NLYVIAELTQELIKVHATSQSWTIPSYPGKVQLPTDILHPILNAEVAREIAKIIYLPEETISWLGTLSNLKMEKKEQKVLAKHKAPVLKTNGRTWVKKKQEFKDKSENEPSSSLDESGGNNVSKKAPEPEPELEPSDDEEEKNAEEQLDQGARTHARAQKQRKAAK
ncbi:hypothetical protein C0993_008121, partial [Termitomyces sp. T159_Od127]